MQSWIVIKFGGNSVSSLPCWQTIGRITQKHLATHRVLIVCSALAGITDKLEQLVVAAKQNQHQPLLQDIIQSYQTLSHELSVNFDYLHVEIEALTNLITGISLLAQASPIVHAKVLAFGEILLTKLGNTFLQQYFPVTWCDARQVLKSIDQPNAS